MLQPNVPSMYRNADKIYFAHAETKPNIVDGDLDVGAISGVEVNVKTETDGFFGTTGTVGSSSTMNADLSYFFGTTLTNSTASHSSSSARKRVKMEGVGTSLSSSSHDAPHRLCQPIEDYGKAAIMALSNYGKPPRFSKYVGALEWKNCVYLWVNLGGKSGYSNAFSEQGRHIMWFGGSKMHKGTIKGDQFYSHLLSSAPIYFALCWVDSHVIQRIARAAKVETIKSEDNKQSPSADTDTETVVLFVRIEGENYWCLGRLQWVAIDLLASPVKVKWELMDYDLFCNDAHFKRLLA